MTGSWTVYLPLFSVIAILSGLSTAVNFRDRETAKRPTLRNKHSAQTKANDGYSSSGPPPCVQGTPQLPNYIQPMQIDPKRILGKWYGYSSWYPGVESSNVTIANSFTTYTNLLNDSLTLYPGSNTPAVAFEQLSGSYSLTENKCDSSTFGALDYATLDGQFRGLAITATGVLVGIDTSLVLSTDYDNYIVYYLCAAYDLISGICPYPDVYIDTRQPIKLVSSGTVSAMNDAVNRIMGPYCVSADMLRKRVVLEGVDDCQINPAPSDDRYKSLRNAYRYLGDPNFNG